MTPTQAVAEASVVAVVGAGEGSNLEAGNRHALLVDAETVGAAARTLGRQARVNILQA